MNQRSKLVGLALVLLGAIGACGDDDNACDPVAQTGCDTGQVCESVTGGAEPACFNPLVVRGKVFNINDTGHAGIQNARVVAIDANGSPASSVAVTDSNGAYELTVPSTRNADGTPIGMNLTLRADAAGFITFPYGLRPSLPVSTAGASLSDNKYVVQTALTDIGLYPQPAGAGTAAIHGKVDVPDGSRGVLVVAESGSLAVGASAIADRTGDYAIFNLAAGDYTVQGYTRGSSYAAATVTLAAGQNATVNLTAPSATVGMVDGSLEMVNGEGATDTSVILVVESTFNTALGRGDMPPGLRVPDPGVDPNVTGAYHFDGVPPGRYIVLAAFENDGWVRDPDINIGGTTTLHITVTGGQATTVDGFKVTGARDIYTPADTGGVPDTITSATPTFTWEDDSSEDGYHLQLLDTFGNEVWTKDLPGVSSGSPTATYDGPALVGGTYYQLRVTSIKNAIAISASEDLTGVFQYSTGL